MRILIENAKLEDMDCLTDADLLHALEVLEDRVEDTTFFLFNARTLLRLANTIQTKEQDIQTGA